MSLRLYATAGSPPCRAVYMLKELLKLKMEITEVRPMMGENIKPEYVAKNPIHTVPYLEDGNFGLADSHAILTYLVSKYGAEQQAKLYPNDLKARAIVDQRMYLDASILFPRFLTPVAKVMIKKIKELPGEDAMRIKEAYGFSEKYLEKTEFIAADHVTVADMACVATISTLNSLVPINDQYPRVQEWWNKLKQESWYRRANDEGLMLIDKFWKKAITKGINAPNNTIR